MSITLPVNFEQAQRRIRVLRAYVATPTDVWLVVRMLTWTLFLPVLKYMLPLPTLARLMWVQAKTGERQPEREQQITTLIRWIYKARAVIKLANCLERSLVIYRFLSEVNAKPQLVVGVRRADDAVLGHAWVIVDAQPIDESLASLKEFVPLIAFGVDGIAQPLVIHADPSSLRV